ncbi:MAG TPA: hypothetical protein VIJ92_01785 [Ginsengibacter sp.]
MLINEQSLALHEAVEQMGYSSVEDFALIQARQQLLQEINICMSNIEKLERKYGVDYADFCKGFQKLTQSIFEKEDDSAEWNAELKQLGILQKRLARLA